MARTTWWSRLAKASPYRTRSGVSRHRRHHVCHPYCTPAFVWRMRTAAQLPTSIRPVLHRRRQPYPAALCPPPPPPLRQTARKQARHSVHALCASRRPRTSRANSFVQSAVSAQCPHVRENTPTAVHMTNTTWTCCIVVAHVLRSSTNECSAQKRHRSTFFSDTLESSL